MAMKVGESKISLKSGFDKYLRWEILPIIIHTWGFNQGAMIAVLESRKALYYSYLLHIFVFYIFRQFMFYLLNTYTYLGKEI